MVAAMAIPMATATVNLQMATPVEVVTVEVATVEATHTAEAETRCQTSEQG